MNTQQRRSERGAVSLFVVIFAALLLSVVTVSFVRVMNQEQQQSTNNDLSQSAYDSAIAGVEDAKRVIMACNAGDDQACTAIDNSTSCSVTREAGIVAEVTRDTNTEVPLETSTSGGRELDQAYTCVKIDKTSSDYLVDLQEGQTVMIPLRGVADVDSISINWFKEERDKISGPNASAALATLGGFNTELPKRAQWPTNGPALMEAQVIQPDADFSVEDFDLDEVSQTVFLYPSTLGLASVDLGGVDRETPSTPAGPRAVRCDASRYTSGGYMCEKRAILSRTLPANSQVAYLRLTALYRPSSVQIQLFNTGGQPVDFNGVQFTVDSTGRANDLFRRVESRLNVAPSDFPYPDGAVELSGSLCKDFWVSNDTAGESGSCTP